MSDWSEWGEDMANEAISALNELSHQNDRTLPREYEVRNQHNQCSSHLKQHPVSSEVTSDDEPLSKYVIVQSDGVKKMRDECDSLSDSSEDIPLIQLKTNRRLFVAENTHSDNPSDSDNDPDYVPSSEEENSDVSECTIGGVQDVNVAGEGNKSELERTCDVSRQEHALYNISVKWHTKRLNNLLTGKGMMVIPVPRNGDCFFAAICSLLPQRDQNVQKLRHATVNHLLENEDHYTQFLSVSKKEETYNSLVGKIQKMGHWSSAVNDLLPLAVANMFNLDITILTSRQTNKTLDITPSMAMAAARHSVTLAYSAIPGMEHYDPCVHINADNSPKAPDLHQTETYSCASDIITPRKNISTTRKRKSPSVTPRKGAKYQSPKKTKLSRKRVSAPDTWRKNIRKVRRLHGKSYMNAEGKTVGEKVLKPTDCSNCFYNCNAVMSEGDREEVFLNFWQLGSYERQNDFIINNVEEKETKKKKSKNFSRKFSFNVKGKRIQVCKKFFLTSLGVSEKKMRIALQRRRDSNQAQGDRRGKHSPPNKTSDERIAGVHNHIKSFPTVESHYARQNTNRKYLSSDLSVAKMYTLYVERCANPVSIRVYRRIFNTEYNLFFHKPKKDQCELCNKYQQHVMTGTCDEAFEQQYEDHQRRKEAARQEKEAVKEVAKNQEGIYAATFDLQAVLSTPCSLVSQVYYKRKLNTYNLSVYSLGDKTGTCYLWNECHGGRGSSEIATCILKHLQSLPRSIKCASLFSDSCTGQNRNQYVATALHYAVSSIPNLEVVEQKFLERGHTQMECDSMHAAIEYAKKRTSIFEPTQWDTVVRMARRNNPFVVVPLNFRDFLDFTKYAKENFQNLVYDVSGKKIAWMKIKVLQVRKEEPGNFFIKYDYNDDFVVVNTNRRQRGRPSTPKGLKPLEEPKTKYASKLPINQKKKQDLLSLCKSGIIPEIHHEFYKRLPSAQNIRDALPEPDVLENEND